MLAESKICHSGKELKEQEASRVGVPVGLCGFIIMSTKSSYPNLPPLYLTNFILES